MPYEQASATPGQEPQASPKNRVESGKQLPAQQAQEAGKNKRALKPSTKGTRHGSPP